MSKINLKEVEKTALEYQNDVQKIEREIKKVQSIKCRLKKMKHKSTYEIEMTNVLKQEQLLKEAKSLLEPKEKPVTQYDENDIKKLDYDEVTKAIRSIQSKKTLTKYLFETIEENEEYKKACSIEKMLIERKKELSPTNEEHVRKTDIQTIIETIENSGSVSQEKILEMFKELIK